MKEKKSDDYFIELPKGISKDEMHQVLENAAQHVGMYISHIGGYSRVKYPNSVHWHFKRDKMEAGLLDATFWDVKNQFWLTIRHREPEWVHEMTPRFLEAIKKALEEI